MRNVMRYGWITLLIAMVGDLLVSYILSRFYNGYSNTMMSISALGNSKSPVRIPFNIWMFVEGVLFLLAIPVIYDTYYRISKGLTIATVIAIITFAIGACIFTTFFSVSETKDIVTTAMVMHGIGSVTGFLLFLLVPLFLAILSFKDQDKVTGIVCVLSFIIAFIFFTLYIMSDKPEFAGSIIDHEGLWQRLDLLFMYLPLGFISVKNFIKLR